MSWLGATAVPGPASDSLTRSSRAPATIGPDGERTGEFDFLAYEFTRARMWLPVSRRLRTLSSTVRWIHRRGARHQQWRKTSSR
ncbi:hypothetical protein [Streptomyces sp. NPDC058620]|uniref:hypothetical protein n=1 Tax=Streptomyces sp. NPDC058620 TaxID=3346560 RepID=UPI003645FB37